MCAKRILITQLHNILQAKKLLPSNSEREGVNCRLQVRVALVIVSPWLTKPKP